MAEDDKKKEAAIVTQQTPFQSNPYGTTRSVSNNTAADLFGGGDGNDAVDSNNIFGNAGSSNNDPFQPQTLVEKTDTNDNDSNNDNNNNTENAATDILQQKAEIIQQQNNESEINVDNATVSVPTIGYNEQGEGDSI